MTTLAQNYLDRGERLIWAGNPDPLRYAIGKGLVIAIVGIPFLAFSIFWVVMAAMPGSLFYLFGIPFVLVGAGFVLSPFFQYWRARGVAYVLTDRRAIIDVPGPFASRASFPLDQIPFISLRRLDRGFGHLMFIERTQTGQRGRTYTTQDGFFGIADAERLERQMREALNRLREESVRA